MRTVLSLLLLAAVPATAQSTGAELFALHCAACHGPAGEGNGPMAEILMTQPPDLTGLADRAGGVFPTYATAIRIDGRHPLLAHGGEMPLWGDVFEGETAAIATPDGQPVLTSAPIAALVAYLEILQR